MVFAFHADGKVAQLNGGNLPTTTGNWIVDRECTGIVPLANGWVMTFTLTEEQVMSVPAQNPGGGREGPWGMKKVEK